MFCNIRWVLDNAQGHPQSWRHHNDRLIKHIRRQHSSGGALCFGTWKLYVNSYYSESCSASRSFSCCTASSRIRRRDGVLSTRTQRRRIHQAGSTAAPWYPEALGRVAQRGSWSLCSGVADRGRNSIGFPLRQTRYSNLAYNDIVARQSFRFPSLHTSTRWRPSPTCWQKASAQSIYAGTFSGYHRTQHFDRNPDRCIHWTHCQQTPRRTQRGDESYQ